MQKRHSGEGKAWLFSQAGTSLGIECCTDRLHDASQTSGESGGWRVSTLEAVP